MAGLGWAGLTTNLRLLGSKRLTELTELTKSPFSQFSQFSQFSPFSPFSPPVQSGVQWSRIESRVRVVWMDACVELVGGEYIWSRADILLPFNPTSRKPSCYACLSICPFVRLSVCPSVLSVYLSVCPWSESSQTNVFVVL